MPTHDAHAPCTDARTHANSLARACVRACTEFEEFKFRGEAQHAKAAADLENKVAKEREEHRRLSEHHARPLPATTYKAFEVCAWIFGSMRVRLTERGCDQPLVHPSVAWATN